MQSYQLRSNAVCLQFEIVEYSSLISFTGIVLYFYKNHHTLR